MITNTAQMIALECVLLIISGYITIRCYDRRETEMLKRFSYLSTVITMFLVVNIPVRLSDLNLVHFEPITVFVLNAIYMMIGSWTAYLWFIFCETIQESFFAKTRKNRLLSASFVFLMVVLVIASYWTKWLFFVNDQGLYERGKLFVIQMAIPYLYMLTAFFSSLIAAFKNRTKKNIRIVLVALIPAFVLSVFQIMFSGSFNFAGFVIAELFIYIEMCVAEHNEIENLKNVESLNKQLIEQQEIMRMAKVQAEEANAAKSSFLARMSHDIRTPLNGIIGLLEIDDKHPEDVKLLAENRVKAKTAANHLLDLISDVLELSKMEDGNVTLSEEPFSAQKFLDDVVTIGGLRAGESGITFTHSFDIDTEKVEYIMGSPLHVRQVLLNIIGNCIKYNNPNGCVDMKVSMNQINDENVEYMVVIKDTGIGMSKEFLEKIFEPFSQANNDARSVYMGTGLGMSIVKSIIEKMGGSIKIESELGVGSTFFVSLPFKIAPSNAVVQEEKVEVVDISGMKALLVEDNELNIEIAEALLEDEGVIITEAHDGQEAIDVFESNPPKTFDFILMDLMMPVLDGLEATKRIRLLDREDAKTIPIIAMTANAFAEDVKKCKDAGMNDHLSKPLNIGKVIETISKYKT